MDIYKDSAKSPAERTGDLLPRMTLEEKAAQIVQVPYSEVTREEALAWAARGTGSFLHVLGENARELQNIALSTRLGIPVIFGIDAIHGHGLHRGATVFPSQLAAACAWDRGLAEAMGRATAREVAADGLHWTFSPVLCIGRDTRWGRVDETFGEDPYLIGELGAAMIKGYQGGDISADGSVLACAKHYIAYGEATGARDACDSEITFRKLREVFLPPFQKAVEAGCATVMTAYGSIDGTPFTASGKALKDILKDELGFEGVVVTDWDNVKNLVKFQRVAGNMEQATLMAVKAGNDMLMTSLEAYEAIIKLGRSGALGMEYIDEAVRRILTLKFRAGLFEKPEKKGDASVFGCKEHLDINLRIARESLTLLENRNSVLPFSGAVRSVAVIGPNADDLRAQYGDWTYFTHPKPDADVEPAPPYYTVLSGIKELAGGMGVDVSYHDGKDIQAAALAAAKCDATVLAIGDVYDEFGEFKDRADLSLSRSQSELFEALRALNKPLVAVLVASKPLCVQEVAEKADALLVMFNGGQFGGLAVAEAIFGKLNPSGRLPISFPRHSGQVPVYYNQLPGWHGGKYCDLPETPLYAFGYGMSYTKYEYSELKADADSLTVSVKVSNTGKAAGAETVQIYFRDEVSSVITPVKQLIAFEKVRLEAGESKTVSFQLDRRDFSLVAPDEKRVTEPGLFTVMAGGSSMDGALIETALRLE